MNKQLYAPPEYINASVSKRQSICNGCGSSESKFDFVPDKIWGMPIKEACDIHDFMYHFAKPYNEEKNKCDRIFLHNLLRLVEIKGGWLKRPRRQRAWFYFKMVQKFGGAAFWEGKN